MGKKKNFKIKGNRRIENAAAEVGELPQLCRAKDVVCASIILSPHRIAVAVTVVVVTYCSPCAYTRNTVEPLFNELDGSLKKLK